jgi:hypothetical protein
MKVCGTPPFTDLMEAIGPHSTAELCDTTTPILSSLKVCLTLFFSLFIVVTCHNYHRVATFRFYPQPIDFVVVSLHLILRTPNIFVAIVIPSL